MEKNHSCGSSSAVAAVVLQLKLQYCSCSSSTILNQFKILNNHCVPNLAILNKSLSELFNLLLISALCLEKFLQLQLQDCSCNYNSTFLNQFRMSNYLHIPNLVIINRLRPKLFNMLLFYIYFRKKYSCCSCCAAAAAAILFLDQFRMSN